MCRCIRFRLNSSSFAQALRNFRLKHTRTIDVCHIRAVIVGDLLLLRIVHFLNCAADKYPWLLAVHKYVSFCFCCCYVVIDSSKVHVTGTPGEPDVARFSYLDDHNLFFVVRCCVQLLLTVFCFVFAVA